MHKIDGVHRGIRISVYNIWGDVEKMVVPDYIDNRIAYVVDQYGEPTLVFPVRTFDKFADLHLPMLQLIRGIMRDILYYVEFAYADGRGDIRRINISRIISNVFRQIIKEYNDLVRPLPDVAVDIQVVIYMLQAKAPDNDAMRRVIKLRIPEILDIDTGRNAYNVISIREYARSVEYDEVRFRTLADLVVKSNDDTAILKFAARYENNLHTKLQCIQKESEKNDKTDS